MFIGHFGLGFGAKAAAPHISLGLLLLAAQFIDLLWPTLLLLDIEHVVIRPGITAVNPLDFVHYPVSHSLLAVLGWGILVGGIYFFIKNDRRGAFLLGLLVLSHWFLDLVVHRPDLPLAPGTGPKVGLGLWDSFWGTLILEGVIFVAGAYIYLKKTKAKNRIGKYAAWFLIAFLVLIQFGNLFGPPPARVEDIAWGAQLQWVLVLLGFWVDKNRLSLKKEKKTGSSVKAVA